MSPTTSMNGLRILHRATVLAEEIDHLGHMNVRYYLEKALFASRALAAEHGLDASACEELSAVLELRDAFTRHYREQLVGAPLAVLSGVLGVAPDGLRLYHELVNTERDERAATFIHELVLRDRKDRTTRPLPEMVAKSAGGVVVGCPDHGRPRTLDLERPPPPLRLDEARSRDLAMRKPRVVQPEECDAHGFYPASRYQELVWGGEPVAPQAGFVPVFELDGGGRFGWATLESRGVLLDLPRAGTRIQSFGAEVALAHKTSCRHNWVFDLDRERLVCSSSIVNLAFDIGARRAIEIPPRIRATLERQFHPDLR